MEGGRLGKGAGKKLGLILTLVTDEDNAIMI